MIQFKHSPIQVAMIESLIRANPSFRNCFTRNITEFFWEDISHHSHAIIIIHGRTGSFKSSIGTIIAQRLDSKFSVKNIGFSNTEVLDISAKSKIGDCFIRDENPYEFGQGSGVRYAQIINLSEQLRARKNSLIYIAPTLRQKIETSHYVLHTLDSSHTELEVEQMQLGKSFVEDVYVRVGLQEPTTETYIGSVIFKLEINSKIWKDYFEKKKEFLKIAPKMEFTSVDYTQIAKETLEKININDFLKANGKVNKGLLKVEFKKVLANRFSGLEIGDIYTCAISLLDSEDKIMENL